MVEVSVFPKIHEARARFGQTSDGVACWAQIESQGGKIIIHGGKAEAERLQMMVAVFNDAFATDPQATPSIEALTYLEAAQ